MPADHTAGPGGFFSPPTCGEHLKLLSRAGLIRGRKIKQWVFYQRDEERIAQPKEALASDW